MSRQNETPSSTLTHTLLLKQEAGKDRCGRKIGKQRMRERERTEKVVEIKINKNVKELPNNEIETTAAAADNRQTITICKKGKLV